MKISGIRDSDTSVLHFLKISQKCRESGDCADYVIEPVLAKLTNSTTGTNLYNVNLFGCEDELFMYIVTLDCLKIRSKKLKNRVLSSYKLRFFDTSVRILIFCDSV